MTELPSEGDPPPPPVVDEGWLLTVAREIRRLTEDLRTKSQDVLYESRPLPEDLSAMQDLIKELMKYVEDEVLRLAGDSPGEVSAPLRPLVDGFRELFDRSQGALKALGELDEAVQYYGPPERRAQMPPEDYEKTQNLVGTRRTCCVEQLDLFRGMVADLTATLPP